MTNAAALRRRVVGEAAFPQQVMELLAFLDGQFPAEHPFHEQVDAVAGPRQDP